MYKNIYSYLLRPRGLSSIPRKKIIGNNEGIMPRTSSSATKDQVVRFSSQIVGARPKKKYKKEQVFKNRDILESFVSSARHHYGAWMKQKLDGDLVASTLGSNAMTRDTFLRRMSSTQVTKKIRKQPIRNKRFVLKSARSLTAKPANNSLKDVHKHVSLGEVNVRKLPTFPTKNLRVVIPPMNKNRAFEGGCAVQLKPKKKLLIKDLLTKIRKLSEENPMTEDSRVRCSEHNFNETKNRLVEWNNYNDAKMLYKQMHNEKPKLVYKSSRPKNQFTRSTRQTKGLCCTNECLDSLFVPSAIVTVKPSELFQKVKRNTSRSVDEDDRLSSSETLYDKMLPVGEDMRLGKKYFNSSKLEKKAYHSEDHTTHVYDQENLKPEMFPLIKKAPKCENLTEAEVPEVSSPKSKYYIVNKKKPFSYLEPDPEYELYSMKYKIDAQRNCCMSNDLESDDFDIISPAVGTTPSVMQQHKSKSSSRIGCFDLSDGASRKDDELSVAGNSTHRSLIAKKSTKRLKNGSSVHSKLYKLGGGLKEHIIRRIPLLYSRSIDKVGNNVKKMSSHCGCRNTTKKIKIELTKPNQNISKIEEFLCVAKTVSEDTRSESKTNESEAMPANQIPIIRDIPKERQKDKDKKEKAIKKNQIKFPPQNDNPALKLSNHLTKEELLNAVKYIEHEIRNTNSVLKELAEKIISSGIDSPTPEVPAQEVRPAKQIPETEVDLLDEYYDGMEGIVPLDQPTVKVNRTTPASGRLCEFHMNQDTVTEKNPQLNQIRNTSLNDDGRSESQTNSNLTGEYVRIPVQIDAPSNSILEEVESKKEDHFLNNITRNNENDENKIPANLSKSSEDELTHKLLGDLISNQNKDEFELMLEKYMDKPGFMQYILKTIEDRLDFESKVHLNNPMRAAEKVTTIDKIENKESEKEASLQAMCQKIMNSSEEQSILIGKSLSRTSDSEISNHVDATPKVEVIYKQPHPSINTMSIENKDIVENIVEGSKTCSLFDNSIIDFKFGSPFEATDLLADTTLHPYNNVKTSLTNWVAIEDIIDEKQNSMAMAPKEDDNEKAIHHISEPKVDISHPQSLVPPIENKKEIIEPFPSELSKIEPVLTAVSVDETPEVPKSTEQPTDNVDNYTPSQPTKPTEQIFQIAKSEGNPLKDTKLELTDQKPSGLQDHVIELNNIEDPAHSFFKSTKSINQDHLENLEKSQFDDNIKILQEASSGIPTEETPELIDPTKICKDKSTFNVVLENKQVQTLNPIPLVKVNIFDESTKEYINNIVKIEANMDFKDYLYTNGMHHQSSKVRNLPWDLLKSYESMPNIQLKVYDEDDSKNLKIQDSFTTIQIKRSQSEGVLLEVQVLDQMLQQYINQIKSIKAKILIKDKANSMAMQDQKPFKVSISQTKASSSNPFRRLFDGDDMPKSKNMSTFAKVGKNFGLKRVPSKVNKINKRSILTSGKRDKKKKTDEQPVTLRQVLQQIEKNLTSAAKDVLENKKKERVELLMKDPFAGLSTSGGISPAETMEELKKCTTGNRDIHMAENITKDMKKYISEKLNRKLSHKINVDPDNKETKGNPRLSLVIDVENDKKSPIVKNLNKIQLETLEKEDLKADEAYQMNNMDVLVSVAPAGNSENLATEITSCASNDDDDFKRKDNIKKFEPIKNKHTRAQFLTPLKIDRIMLAQLEKNGRPLRASDAVDESVQAVLHKESNNHGKNACERTNSEETLRRHVKEPSRTNINDRSNEAESHFDPYADDRATLSGSLFFENRMEELCRRRDEALNNVDNKSPTRTKPSNAKIATPKLRYVILKNKNASDYSKATIVNVSKKKFEMGPLENFLQINKNGKISYIGRKLSMPFFKDEDEAVVNFPKIVPKKTAIPKKFCEKIYCIPFQKLKEVALKNPFATNLRETNKLKEAIKILEPSQEKDVISLKTKKLKTVNVADYSSSSKDTLLEFDMSPEIDNPQTVNILKQLEGKLQDTMTEKNNFNSHKLINLDMGTILEKLEQCNRIKKAKKNEKNISNKR